MAQGESTKIILMIKWIWTSRLPIKNSLSGARAGLECPGKVLALDTQLELTGEYNRTATPQVFNPKP